ncbi:ankyrin repeat and MYND domain-containing protein 2-like isoform X2 [Dysidea avara]|uniref:ankyrin repeat and MYND domain-containing protein 2-like isoform X2 n=1 Tax=Dysidea avara TaxID=196820 RepID=UPI00332103CD
MKHVCHSEDGTTPLSHAAYKGNGEACNILLEHGADVNWAQHGDKYTPLMFSMMSGSPSTTKLLLEAGADKDAFNNMHRNAFQVAVSLGQYGSIGVLKNFMPLKDVKRYCSGKGFPSLPTHLVKPVYQLVTTTDIHPVKLILELQTCKELLDTNEHFCAVLESLQREHFLEDHYVLAFKLHYISYIVQYCTVDQDGDQILLKRLLQAKEPSGTYPEVDGFLRQCVREYEHTKECSVSINMIQTLSTIPIGDERSTYSVFHEWIVAHKSDEDKECSTCGRFGKELSRCSKCKKVYYCSPECQKLAWTVGNHKKLCKLWREP